VRLHTVTRQGPGRLSLMARPSGAHALGSAMRRLRERGVDTVVSLLGEAEAHAYGLAQESEAARAAGMRFYWLPVADGAFPERDGFRFLIDDVLADLVAGRHVGVHGNSATGRAALVGVGVLRSEGLSSPAAWRTVEEALGQPTSGASRLWVELLDVQATRALAAGAA
jgi:hypothetical protein